MSKIKFVAGDTVSLTVAKNGYAPGEGWTLALVLVGRHKTYTFAGSDGGNGSFVVDLTPTQSRDVQPGSYSVRGVYTKAPDRYTVDLGPAEVQPDLASQESGFDLRTPNRRRLDALVQARETLISGAHRVTVSSESMGGRSRTFRTLEELDSAIRRAERDVARDTQRERAAQGLPGGVTRVVL